MTTRRDIKRALSGPPHGRQWREAHERIARTFVSGGSFDIASPTDSKVVMFRVTSGPTIHVRTPEQRARARRRARMLWWLGVALWLGALAWAVLQ